MKDYLAADPGPYLSGFVWTLWLACAVVGLAFGC